MKKIILVSIFLFACSAIVFAEEAKLKVGEVPEEENLEDYLDKVGNDNWRRGEARDTLNKELKRAREKRERKEENERKMQELQKKVKPIHEQKKEYYENGALKKETDLIITNPFKTGKITYYHEDGSVKKEENYKKFLTSSASYYPNGKIMRQRRYLQRGFVSVFTIEDVSWNDDGTLKEGRFLENNDDLEFLWLKQKSFRTYKKGKIEGSVVFKNVKTGKDEYDYEFNYKNGVLHGEMNRYNSSTGELYSRDTYDNGIKIKSEAVSNGKLHQSCVTETLINCDDFDCKGL